VARHISTSAPSLLAVDRLTIHGNAGPLVVDASFVLAPSQRLGLVGRNGGGKSTLLHVLDAVRHGHPPPAHVTVGGGIAWSHGATCGLLPQHPRPADVDATVAAWLDARAGERGSLFLRHEQLAAAMSQGAHDEQTLTAYGEVVHRLSALEAWDYVENRERVVLGLGLDPASLQRRLGEVSGGQATRVALAGLLLSQPDVLLLDEPTNNLDSHGVDFLRGWLRESTAAVLLVSHDRDLLDASATAILSIDEATRVVGMYGGNWSAYVARRRVEFDAQVRAYEEQQARRRELLDSAARIAGRAQGFQAMSQNDFYRSRGKKLARRATVQLARVERQLSALAEPLPPRRPHFVVRHGDPRDAALLQARAISVGHAGADPLIDDFSLTLRHGDRVAIAGASGTGKTSLLRTLLGELPLQAGDVDRPRDLRAGHLAQSQATWNGNLRAVDVVRRVATVTEDEAHVIIASVLFDDVATRPMRSFSAGERRRIELAAMFAARPELLALDEPSNHLDLPTLEMLEEALADYSGALLVVSHDRYPLERLQPQRVIALDAENPTKTTRTTIP